MVAHLEKKLALMFQPIFQLSVNIFLSKVSVKNVAVKFVTHSQASRFHSENASNISRPHYYGGIYKRSSER